MADFSQNIANLQAALSSGEKLIEIDGMKVMYQNSGDIIKSLNYFQQQQATAAAGSQTTLAAFGAE